MKLYQVIVQDEWNNLTELGYYKDLRDAVPEVNSFLEVYGVQITEDDLVEYPSTFSMVFDLNLGDLFPDNDEVYAISIRGFIYDGEALLDEISKLVK